MCIYTSSATSEQGSTVATEALAELQEKLQALELERSEVDRLLQEKDQVFAATIAEKDVTIAKAVEERDQIIAATVAEKDAEKAIAVDKAVQEAVQEAVQIERLAAM